MPRSIVPILMQQKPVQSTQSMNNHSQEHQHGANSIVSTIISKNGVSSSSSKYCCTKSMLSTMFLWFVIIIPWCKIIMDTMSIRQWDYHISPSSLSLSFMNQQQQQQSEPKLQQQQQQQDAVAVISTTTRRQRKIRQEKPNTSWNSIQYVSGVYMMNDNNNHNSQLGSTIKSQCDKQSGVFYDSKTDVKYLDIYCAGPIQNNYTCCYCYDEFPMFLYDDPIRWSSHIQYIEQKQQQLLSSNNNKNKNDLRYWFCAEPRSNKLMYEKHTNQNDLIPFDDVDVDTIDNNNNDFELIIVTGKWGYRDQHQDEVINFCIEIHDILSFLNGNYIHCYEHNIDRIIQDERFNKHLIYRNKPNDKSKNGAGYWFHRYIMIQHQMIHPYGNDHDNHELEVSNTNDNNSIINPNAIIVWCDVDRIDLLRYGTFNSLIYTMELRNADFIIESHHFIEYPWTKEDIFVAFNASEEMKLSKQVNSNAFLIRNNIKMRIFMDAIVDCISDWHMISDDASYTKNNIKYFKEHRYDQSILSLFVKTFLINRTIIGPPSQNYAPTYSSYYSYILPDNVIPYCPFESFYKSHPQYNKAKQQKQKSKKI